MKFLEAMQRADQALALMAGGDEVAREMAGYRKIAGGKLDPRSVLYTQRVMEGLISGRMNRVERALRLQEAQTTSDFPYLMGDNMYRRLLAQYSEVPVSWPSIAERNVVNDFRNFRSIAVDGATAPLDPVAELAPYNQRLIADSKYDVAVAKFGDKMGFSWESFINDDLQGLKRAPMLLGEGARNLEEKGLTALYAGNATFFSNANKNKVNIANGASSNNPVLSPGAITDALTVMRKQVNSDGSPILITGVTLVVPTALDETADRILNAQSVWWNDFGGTTNQRLLVNNSLPGRLTKVCAAWLDVINASSHGATGWYIFANPASGRPAIQIAFLRGHEQPEMFMKSSNALLVGGGESDAFNGSFENDSIEYKIRHEVGFGLMDPKAAVYSDGTAA